MSFSILTLFTPETATKIFNIGIGLAKTVGLPVDSWRTGDPTRSLYKYVATKLAAVDQTVANLARSAVLSVLVQAASNGDEGAKAWLKVVALEQFGIEVQEATFAQSAAGFGVTLLNSGGGVYPIEVGDVTFKSSTTGKTYHNTTAGTLASGPGTTLLLEFVADEAGSDSTVTADEIDELVTTLNGVTIQSSAAAVGLDEESPESVYLRCKDSLAALSPDGPRDVYRYIALNADKTGITTITRAEPIDNEDGTCTLYVANPSGSATTEEVEAVQAAIDTWATPLGFTCTVVSALAFVIDTTADVAYGGSLTDEELETQIANKIATALAALRIGGDPLVSGNSGVAYDLIIAAIRSISGVTSVSLSVPADDTLLEPNEVPVPGDVEITVV